MSYTSYYKNVYITLLISDIPIIAPMIPTPIGISVLSPEFIALVTGATVASLIVKFSTAELFIVEPPFQKLFLEIFKFPLGVIKGGAFNLLRKLKADKYINAFI